jgi:hypothetical protein
MFFRGRNLITWTSQNIELLHCHHVSICSLSRRLVEQIARKSCRVKICNVWRWTLTTDLTFPCAKNMCIMIEASIYTPYHFICDSVWPYASFWCRGWGCPVSKKICDCVEEGSIVVEHVNIGDLLTKPFIFQAKFWKTHGEARTWWSEETSSR